MDASYWDPLATPPAALQNFTNGRFHHRNWRNVPGPFYGHETDTCGTGPAAAPDNVLVDFQDYQEFVWRQPRNEAELGAVLEAAGLEVFAGYACDGDQHWSVDSVRDWWRERQRLDEWIQAEVTVWTTDRGHGEKFTETILRGLDSFSAHLHADLAGHLRGYMFWLDERRPATANERLPDL